MARGSYASIWVLVCVSVLATLSAWFGPTFTHEEPGDYADERNLDSAEEERFDPEDETA